MTTNVVTLLALSLSLSACLRTRSEVNQMYQPQEIAKEQRRAEFNVQFQSLEEQMRHIYGRLEAIENTMRQRSEFQSQVEAEKLQNFQEVWARIKILEQEIDQLKGHPTSQPQPQAFASAEAHFQGKRWKKAALSYEKYRMTNPKGEHYPLATYKIGVSFEELGEKENAKLFYEEVVEKFPNHILVKKANDRIKKLKVKTK